MEIMANRMDRGFYRYQKEFEDKAISVLRSGWYVLGKEVEAFEEEFAAYMGAKYCVGVASGLDALYLAFRALGIGAGDEVIVQGNTYIASVMGITMNHATPVFVEPDPYYLIDTREIESQITPRTKAILPVHLYGQASRMDAVMRLAKKHGLRVVEDCAQSHGARYQTPGGSRAASRGASGITGTFGDIGCFSFYPSKNLGAFGDGGAVITDDAALADEIRILRNYGSEKRYHNQEVGVNSRLDELQAGLLRVRLSHLDEINEERGQLCARYLDKIENPAVRLPAVREGATSVWHQFVISCGERDALRAYLGEKGISTLIHYPIPPHLSGAYRYLGITKGSLPLTERLADSVLSLPLYNGMTLEEQDEVIEAVNAFLPGAYVGEKSRPGTSL